MKRSLHSKIRSLEIVLVYIEKSILERSQQRYHAIFLRLNQHAITVILTYYVVDINYINFIRLMTATQKLYSIKGTDRGHHNSMSVAPKEAFHLHLA